MILLIEIFQKTKTVQQLRNLLQQLTSRPFSDDELIDYANHFDATSFLETATASDLAAMFREGMLPKDTLDSVQELLDTFFECDDIEHEIKGNCAEFIAYIVEDFNPALANDINEYIAQEATYYE